MDSVVDVRVVARTGGQLDLLGGSLHISAQVNVIESGWLGTLLRFLIVGIGRWDRLS